MSDTRPEYLEFKTADGLTLPGLLYRAPRSNKLAIFLHGNGTSSVFYGGKKNKLFADTLAQAGISTLYFNNRGAHLVKRLRVQKGKVDERKNFGMAHEQIRECVYDIEGAIALGKKQGFTEFYLVGFSTGANKICVYNYLKPKNPVSAYVIVCGGDDVGIYYQQLGKKKFWDMLVLAKRRTRAGRGDELMPELLPVCVFSGIGFYDIANPDGDYNVFPYYEAFKPIALSKKQLFRYFSSIEKPALVVYGERDEYIWGSAHEVVTLLRSYRPACDYIVIPGADHGFAGYERVLARKVKQWLGGITA